jgi:hypothetical protein
MDASGGLVPTTQVPAATLPSVPSRGPSYACSLAPLIKMDAFRAPLVVSLSYLFDCVASSGYPLAFFFFSDRSWTLYRSIVQAVYLTSRDLIRLGPLFDEKSYLVGSSALRCSPCHLKRGS